LSWAATSLIFVAQSTDMAFLQPRAATAIKETAIRMIQVFLISIASFD